MPTKIFITGITGYIGGDTFYRLHENNPNSDFEFSALIRSNEKAQQVRAKYPHVRTVIGDLDDADKITKEAAWADVVIRMFFVCSSYVLRTLVIYITPPSSPHHEHATAANRDSIGHKQATNNATDTADSSDHVGAANAIAKGLVEGHTAQRPGYWLHTGGTGILTYFDSEVRKTAGEHDDKIFNDWDGVDELVNLPAGAFHRNVDELVLQTGTRYADRVKTAIICPPTIYGVGRGPVPTRGRQVYELTTFILKGGYVPLIGRGLARWNNVHVRDLSRLFEALVRVAGDSSRKDDGEVWGAKGYFLSENGEHVWGELSKAIGEEVFKQGFRAQQPESKALSLDEAVKSPAGFEAASWGWNSRAAALRGEKVLGWKAEEKSLLEEVPEIVRSEAARLGL